MSGIDLTKWKLKEDQLQKLGFEKKKDGYLLNKPLKEQGLVLVVTITDQALDYQVYDQINKQEYIVYKMPKANGPFVESIRNQIDETINLVKQECLEPDMFQSRQAQMLIETALECYQSPLEYLWDDYEGAIVRRQDNHKWYALFSLLSLDKLGLEKEKREVLNLHVLEPESKELIDHKRIFPGWHMNKKRWISIVLDESLSDKELLALLHHSFLISGPKRKKSKKKDTVKQKAL